MMVTNAARFGTDKALEPLRRVNAAGTHLLGLINEVLDLSKIEAGKLELNLEPVKLPGLIDEVIGTAGQLADKNKNRLIVEAQQNIGALTADPIAVTGHRLAVDQKRPRPQRFRGRRNQWKAAGPIVAVARQQAYAGAVAPHHRAEAVELYLVDPVGPGWRAISG
jgi:hypothetical protein